jgi:hypothetical protein
MSKRKPRPPSRPSRQASARLLWGTFPGPLLPETVYGEQDFVAYNTWMVGDSFYGVTRDYLELKLDDITSSSEPPEVQIWRSDV